MSLTSYPPRFGTLHLALACLLDQSVAANRTILWIADADLGEVPEAIRGLERRGLEIRPCDDLRSYKKLIPALDAFPDAYIATADDDVFYRRDWLEKLASGAERGVITCHRAHRIKHLPDGRIAPYLGWQFDVQDARARRPSPDILPTGIGGVLYPPHSLDPRVTDRCLFEPLCPDGDDLWFYWCARSLNSLYKKVGGRLIRISWEGSQQASLWQTNEAGGNDRMIAALEKEFGYLDFDSA